MIVVDTNSFIFGVDMIVLAIVELGRYDQCA